MHTALMGVPRPINLLRKHSKLLTTRSNRSSMLCFTHANRLAFCKPHTIANLVGPHPDTSVERHAAPRPAVQLLWAGHDPDRYASGRGCQGSGPCPASPCRAASLLGSQHASATATIRQYQGPAHRWRHSRARRHPQSAHRHQHGHAGASQARLLDPTLSPVPTVPTVLTFVKCARTGSQP